MSEVGVDEALKLDNQVCFAVSVANRAIISLYRPLLEPLGLTHPQYLVMLALWEDSPRSVNDLCEVLLQDAPTISPLLKRLELAGLLTRQRSSRDERRLEVELTEEGRQLKRLAPQVPAAVVKHLDMKLEELADLRAKLWEVIEATKRIP
ncbi:MarR family winged helix-turn-helix transcriptional regulator [Leucobacter ruminantium]|uniref:MarR family transcriptional regulator n=1 Tax=Leucobacter ruminantium TaxID=1289170 RepID=A0A939M120_9MICO|nr:MarR family transcriptional regulator [Leucobacter ruminantium]MBO1806623.1 MarR family transcriptional regulator [Leucobacter ruminantium]